MVKETKNKSLNWGRHCKIGRKTFCADLVQTGQLATKKLQHRIDLIYAQSNVQVEAS